VDGGAFVAFVVDVRALSVAVEDHDEFGGVVDGGEGVGCHGGELGGFAVSTVMSRSDPSQQISAAAAAGSRVAAAISFDLAEDDLQNRTRASSNEADWDHRYQGDQLWSGNPNGALVHQISGMTPGSALDVGAGEGGDALWLADHRWQVTASGGDPVPWNAAIRHHFNMP
jgi:hypothetical protein